MSCRITKQDDGPFLCEVGVKDIDFYTTKEVTEPRLVKVSKKELE